jgi:hypothetical protein
MKTMLHEIWGNVMVSVQGDVPMSDEDWDDYLATVDANLTSLKAFLISADNHGPNAGQRAKLDKQRAVYPLPKAVVTTSMAIRGIVTATSWLGSKIRAFSPANIDEAFAYLSVAEPDRAALLELVAILKTRLAGGETWGQLREPSSGATPDPALMRQVVAERVASIRAKLRSIQGRD